MNPMTQTSPPRRPAIEWPQDVPALLLFLCLPILSFPELFFSEQTLYRGDLTWIHYPLRLFAAQEWLAGRIPLWNPYVLLGSPLLAEAEIGVLQPLNAIFLLPIPTYRALTLFVMLHFTLAALFTYTLARTLSLGRAAATLAGLSFGFGGFLMAQVTNLNVMTGAAWLPLVFCSLIWTVRSRRWLVALWSGLPLALHIVAAHPQIPLYTATLLVSFALYESFRTMWPLPRTWCAWRDIGQIWLLLTVMFGSGLLLAAPQILPTLELQPLSVRSQSVEAGQMIFSISPVQWLTLLLPNAFGTTVTGFHGLRGNFEETNVYIGLVCLCLLPLSWRLRREPRVLFWGLVALISGILSLGDNLPFYESMQQLPLLKLFRAPARWSMLVNLALALLAAYGLESLLNRPLSRRSWTMLLGVWATMVVGLLLLWIFQAPLFQWVDSLPRTNDWVRGGRELIRRGLFETPREYGSRLILGTVAWWLTPAVALVIRSGMTIGLLGLSARMPKSVFVPLMLTLVAVDMALTGGTAVNRITAADHFEQRSGGIQYIQAHSDALSRFYTIASSQEDEVVAGLKHYFPTADRLLASGGHSSLRLQRYDNLMQQAHPLVRLSVTGSRYLLNKGALGDDGEAVLPRVYQDDTWYVYEHANHLPIAFVMREAIVVETDEYALSYLRNGSYDPSTRLILQADQPVPHLLTESSGQDNIDLVQYTPNRIEIQADLADDGFLVLLNNHYPGWQAYVDGQPQPIMRAYYLAQAIFVEQGTHTVEFVYVPRAFWGGVALASVTALSLIIATVLSLKAVKPS